MATSTNPDSGANQAMADARANAGLAYGALITEQLMQERARKASIEQRGLAVITTAGTLVTILLALPALATKAGQTYVLPNDARLWFLAALVLLVASAAGALASNWILNYDEVTATGLRELVEESWWSGPADEGARLAGQARVEIIITARTVNSRKAGALVWAMALEGAGIATLAVAAAIVLVHG
jgi:hypothetical protein